MLKAIVLLGVFFFACGQEEKKLSQEELMRWKAPRELEKGLVYYHSGFDTGGSPVWITEFGRWDMKRWAEGTKEERENLDIYLEQYYARIEDSIVKANKPDSPVTEFVRIYDMEGYDLTQLTSMPTVRKVQQVLVGKREWTRERLKASYVINTNFVFQTLWNLISPILATSSDRIHIFGTNAQSWKPVLVKNIPSEALPEFY